MGTVPRGLAAAAAGVMVMGLVGLGGSPAAQAVAPVAGAAGPRLATGGVVHDAQSVIDWQRVAIRTVYTEGLNPPPVGALYLGFTSLAVHDAVQDARRRGGADRDAAVAVAAHDVLAEYFPASAANLAASLAASLALVPDGPRKTKGMALGADAADDMIASRVGDGRNDASVVYSVPSPTPAGVWAAPATGFVAPWLGFVKPLVVHGFVPARGPTAMTSARYAAELNEVKEIGSATSTTRTPEQTATALFFTANPVAQLHLALCAYLEANPIGLARTARLFATSEAAIADSLIQAWNAKFTARQWRPFQAIQGAGSDGNPGTEADLTWTSLVFPNPGYPDHFSGHGSVTSSFAGSVRKFLGDDVSLTLVTPTASRTYPTLSAIEHDSFMARIWAGIHVRRAMEVAYHVGHVNAHRVGTALRSHGG